MTVMEPTGRLSRATDVGEEPPWATLATVDQDSSEPAGAGRLGSLLGDRYRLDELIARGATAEVFRGTDELLGRRVAVKVFDPVNTDLNSVERRRVEVEVLASLSDPHLVTVHDAHIDRGPHLGRSDEKSFVVMELVEGPTLAEEIGNGPVEPARAAHIGAAVAAALDTMHRRGLVHRDVKPANILSNEDGAVKLGDFGLARVLTADARVTSAPMVMGTAAFFSPEQASGQDVEAPSDVYSLGLVLLEALTGRREYPGSPVQSAVARLLRGPVIPTGPTLALAAPARRDDQRGPTDTTHRRGRAGRAGRRPPWGGTNPHRAPPGSDTDRSWRYRGHEEPSSATFLDHRAPAAVGRAFPAGPAGHGGHRCRRSRRAERRPPRQPTKWDQPSGTSIASGADRPSHIGANTSRGPPVDTSNRSHTLESARADHEETFAPAAHTHFAYRRSSSAGHHGRHLCERNGSRPGRRPAGCHDLNRTCPCPKSRR